MLFITIQINKLLLILSKLGNLVDSNSQFFSDTSTEPS